MDVYRIDEIDLETTFLESLQSEFFIQTSQQG